MVSIASPAKPCSPQYQQQIASTRLPRMNKFTCSAMIQNSPENAKPSHRSYKQNWFGGHILHTSVLSLFEWGHAHFLLLLWQRGLSRGVLKKKKRALASTQGERLHQQNSKRLCTEEHSALCAPGVVVGKPLLSDYMAPGCPWYTCPSPLCLSPPIHIGRGNTQVP